MASSPQGGASSTPTNYHDIPCCPDLLTDPVCDVMDMRRRLTFPTSVRTEQGQRVSVEVIIHTRFSRCTGPMALGDLVYTTTLLPGETVRLATTDRRSRFSFDSESQLSYHSEQLSEEQYRMSSLRAFMSDASSTDNGSNRSTDKGSWDFHGDASGSIGFMSASADANARGSHNAESTFDYLQQHRAHAQMADNLSVESTRKAHSVSVGEVSSRDHKEGESQDHFESSSRAFKNPNDCHALTFFFYRINKTETIRFEFVAIERRVLDAAAPTPVLANPIRAVGGVALFAQEVPATNSKRLEIEARGLQSEQQYNAASPLVLRAGTGLLALSPNAANVDPGLPPITDAVRKAALAEVDKLLTARGIVDVKQPGAVNKELRLEIEYTRTTALPTAGIIVKGCYDECDVCEPEVKRRHQLELDRMDLENQMLKRQIDLLDKAQEYRCCPVGEAEPTPA
ncbi:MAG: hypothetical protein KGJ44_02530 [Betaproteobacteria bacterium]|nr:hypothetical protein [Betaproteobacteria bacterium]